MNTVKMLVSSMSHMPLYYTFQRSGVAQKYGFDLEFMIGGRMEP